MSRAIWLLPLGLLLATAACDAKGGAMKVDKVEPEQGITGGGDQISVIGSGFQPGKTQVDVRFGRRKSEQVTISSSSKILVLTPPGERGPVDVTLSFDNGTTFKIPNGFRYTAPTAAEDTRKAFFSSKPGEAAKASTATKSAEPPDEKK